MSHLSIGIGLRKKTLSLPLDTYSLFASSQLLINWKAVNVLGDTANVERTMIGWLLSLTCEQCIDVQRIAALTIPPGVMHGP